MLRKSPALLNFLSLKLDSQHLNNRFNTSRCATTILSSLTSSFFPTSFLITSMHHLVKLSHPSMWYVLSRFNAKFRLLNRICDLWIHLHQIPRIKGYSAAPLQHDQRKTSTTRVVCFYLALHLFRVCLVLPNRWTLPPSRSSGPMQPLPSSRGMRCRFRKDPGDSTRLWAHQSRTKESIGHK